jgi:hypothetical protein
MSAYKIQTPGNYPEKNTQQIVHFYWNSSTKLSFSLSQRTKKILHTIIKNQLVSTKVKTTGTVIIYVTGMILHTL